MFHNIYRIKEHLILKLDQGMWLLDTGAPESFGSINKLEIDGQSYEVASDYMGFDIGNISEALDEDIVGLIGGDVLSNYDTYWDLSLNRISFSKESIEYGGNSIALDFFMGIPTLKVNLRGATYKWFFDTGAVISYVTEQLEEWESPVDQYDDFYPGYGDFSTEVYEDEITLEASGSESDSEEAHRVTTKFGVLPAMLGMSLAIGGCNGILGLKALNNQSFLYAPRRNKLILNAQ